MNPEILGYVGTEFSEEQLKLHDDMQKANALKQLKMSAGWEIVLATMDTIREGAMEELGQIMPGDRERIIDAHAVYYAVKGTIENLVRAVDDAIVRGDLEAPRRLKEIQDIHELPQNGQLTFEQMQF